MTSATTPPVTVIVGGCGHVGLPLGVALAGAGQRVFALDIDPAKVAKVNNAEVPFIEAGLPEALAAVRAAGTFEATLDPTTITAANTVIVVIGTPVDEHLNPDPNEVVTAVTGLAHLLCDGQLLVLRSTVYPGVTRRVAEALTQRGLRLDVACCPERLAEGVALPELRSLPQIIGADTPAAIERAVRLFDGVAPSCLVVSTAAAELAKLFTNVWRYLKFAAANQFFMLADGAGVDYAEVYRAITTDYPRARDLPAPGLTAGPCLFKDTMQLSAYSDNTFALGHAAMLINEGLPSYIVRRVEEQFDLRTACVGILGMAFKANVDDTRSSLSYKLRRLLRFRAARVLCADPLLDDPRLVPVAEVIAEADLILIATPHDDFAGLEFRQPVVNVWDMTLRIRP
ncbi:MAG: nucleotide sugar dehydrogenase [Actinomycetales bacterium]|nr:nucleotide sugar dehydrogenase [Actinomycetales bacterium]